MSHIVIASINQYIRSNARNSRLYAYAVAASLSVCIVTIGTVVIMNNQNPAVIVEQSVKEITNSGNEGDLLREGQWKYMPGTRLDVQGLHIRPITFAIVEQDGTGGQPNPPINLFGTHLKVSGDFGLNARLENLKHKAILQLYGEVPLIADEFRIERRSVQLTFDEGRLRASLWNGGSQEPAIQTFNFVPDETLDLAINRKADSLAFTVNGKQIGSVAENGVFSTGEVWFGASAERGEWLLAALQAKKLNDSTTLEVIDSSSLKVERKNSKDLQILAAQKRPDFLVGAAMALAPAVSDLNYAQIAFGGNFGSMTTENALKWQFVHPGVHTYEFHESDALVKLAERHNLKVHGHTLVFGEANPRWVQNLPVNSAVEKERIERVMIDHIKTVVGHYKERVSSWDVVNEPLADYDSFEAGAELRQHKWFQAMGEGYIAKAFETAHLANPKAQLFINEYGLEADGERWDSFVSLIKKLKAQLVPIDGIGFQAHVYEASDRIDPGVLKQHIRQMAQLGLKVRISEMDVYTDDGQAVQAQQYADVFRVCFAEPNCLSWTTWGVTDRYNIWKDDESQIQYGKDYLWNSSSQPIPAVTKIKQLLE